LRGARPGDSFVVAPALIIEYWLGAAFQAQPAFKFVDFDLLAIVFNRL